MTLSGKHEAMAILSSKTDTSRQNGTAAQEQLELLREFLDESGKELNRRKRRQRIFIISICTLLLIALTAFLFSETNRRRAVKLQEQIARTAKANGIATKAYTTLEHDPTLAFRLAEASYGIEPTPLNKQVIMASYAQVPFYYKMEGHWTCNKKTDKKLSCI